MSPETMCDGLALKKKTCTGCHACYNICPTNAIEMKLDKWGLLVSSVNVSTCVYCGKCADVCPQINPMFKNTPAPSCYAIKADDAVLEECSSGGVFPLLCDYVLSQGGYVCGPIYDSDMNVVFKITNDRAILKKMQGSKYVFSEMGNIYKEIKEKLDANKLVLFTGCPCQVAGVKNFIGKNDKLITADLLCAGLPSKSVFQRYLKDVSDEKKIVDVQFRSKKYPYGTTVMKFDDGTERVQRHDLYFLGFLSDLYKSDACAECTFANTPRQGDLSIGDLWKADLILDDTDLSRGMSCVLVNNDIGRELFNKIYKNAPYCKKISLKFLRRYNRLHNARPSNMARARFFSMLDRGQPLLKSISYSVKWKYDVGITGFWRVRNFGGVLTYYALYKLVLDLGLEPLMIEARYNSKGLPSSPALLGAKYPGYYLARYRNTVDEQYELNEHASKFIVGSDQVWNRDLLNQSTVECYMLDFVDDPMKRISIASSFGTGSLKGTEEEQQKFIELLKKFDSVSVRENSGVKLCDKLGIKATRILDPVLLCDEKHYMDLIDSSDAVLPTNYAFYYLGNVSSPNIETVAQKMGYGIIKIRRRPKKDDVVPETPVTDIGTVENWLKCIYNSSFVVSDSYHATVFAILFKKPFVLIHGKIKSDDNEADKFTTLLNMFGLRDRLFKSANEVSIEDLMKPIDYDKVHSILEREREISMEWVRKALFNNDKK